ncbi:PIN2/TERF1-interacting telomerase inhibitor 1 isoform X1 [Eleginops maclovinus]|uniref:PIN2/TERF1-interacting telomerase inhibitor 1 isoform X1 n=1 Tax=Eleginops maclovinus TaxID=56733 RepID=UPI003080D414
MVSEPPASSEDKWIAHQDDFNELLAQLNNHHGQNSSAEPPKPEEPKGFSLEEKSKTSKKRVHYMKFTKGKDLSSRSKTDLNCIFGKRGGSSNDIEKESDSSDSHGETEKTLTPAVFKLDTETITNTVKSTLTMQEYFAQRMAQLKKARGQAQSEEPSMETVEASSQSEEPNPILITNDDSEEPKKKKKKRKKSKKSDDDLEVVEENSTPFPVITVDNEDQERSGKKKKKRKLVESEEVANENCSSTSGVEQNSDELPPSKKKKHKKQHKDTELQNGHGPTEDESVEPEVVEKKSKKDKKKKKKHQE